MISIDNIIHKLLCTCDNQYITTDSCIFENKKNAMTYQLNIVKTIFNYTKEIFQILDVNEYDSEEYSSSELNKIQFAEGLLKIIKPSKIKNTPQKYVTLDNNKYNNKQKAINNNILYLTNLLNKSSNTIQTVNYA
jgi:hypothetical protein